MTDKQLKALEKIVPEYEYEDKTYTTVATPDGDNGWINQWYVWDDSSEDWEAVNDSEVPDAVFAEHDPY